MEFNEVVTDELYIIEGIGPVGMPGYLRNLPRSKLRVDLPLQGLNRLFKGLDILLQFNLTTRVEALYLS